MGGARPPSAGRLSSPRRLVGRSMSCDVVWPGPGQQRNEDGAHEGAVVAARTRGRAGPSVRYCQSSSPTTGQEPLPALLHAQ